MKPFPYLASLLCILVACNRPEKSDLLTHFEKNDSLSSPTYEEAMDWWKNLDKEFKEVKLLEAGETDAGLPLHLAVLSPSGNFSPDKTLERGKTVVLINNAIHPGEPDGVDASMLLYRDILLNEERLGQLEDIVVLCIPFYNVGGARNRGCCSRANQNGPEEYGFRGNARNLDLNRDFIKADSRNAKTFHQIFHEWKPDLYVETHVTNGADYPYTMTYLSALPGKTEPAMKEFLETDLVPWLENKMAEKGDEMAPYINIHGDVPDKGFSAFYDSPRYSTGYATLFQTIGFITETHMLKPFPQRVASTLRFLDFYLEYAAHNSEKIKSVRARAQEEMMGQENFNIAHELDSSQVRPLPFNGFEARMEKSNVTGLDRIRYDRSKMWQKDIPFYYAYAPTLSVVAPSAYILKPGWEEVADLLRINQVEMHQLKEDSLMELEVYYIHKYETVKTPYEGHYLHYDTQTETRQMQVVVPKYSYVIPIKQRAKRFLVEVLEPGATDSYFNWNFFDEILQQKEWFSGYVFEDEAEQMLDDDTLKASFQAFLASDSMARNNSFAQLYWLYKKSGHYEKEHMQYPVYRLMK